MNDLLRRGPQVIDPGVARVRVGRLRFGAAAVAEINPEWRAARSGAGIAYRALSITRNVDRSAVGNDVGLRRDDALSQRRAGRCCVAAPLRFRVIIRGNHADAAPIAQVGSGDRAHDFYL